MHQSVFEFVRYFIRTAVCLPTKFFTFLVLMFQCQLFSFLNSSDAQTTTVLKAKDQSFIQNYTSSMKLQITVCRKLLTNGFFKRFGQETRVQRTVFSICRVTSEVLQCTQEVETLRPSFTDCSPGDWSFPVYPASTQTSRYLLIGSRKPSSPNVCSYSTFTAINVKFSLHFQRTL